MDHGQRTDPMKQTRGLRAYRVVLLLQGLEGDIITPQRGSRQLPQLSHKLLHILPLLDIKLLLELGEVLVNLVRKRGRLVPILDQLLLDLVLFGELLRFLDHSLDLAVGKTGARGDGHGLFSVGGLVDGGDVDDTVTAKAMSCQSRISMILQV